jgi:hypothetical protein
MFQPKSLNGFVPYLVDPMPFEAAEHKAERVESKVGAIALPTDFEQKHGPEQKQLNMEQTNVLVKQGILPKIELSDIGKSLQQAGETFSKSMGDAAKAALKGSAYALDYLAGCADRATNGTKIESNYDIAKSDNPALKELAHKDPYRFNCHYMTKTFIEGKQPSEPMEFMGRAEVVTPQYLDSHGFKPIKGEDIRPGDVVLCERSADAKGAAFVKELHSAIVVEGADHQPKTLQKLDPDKGISALSLAQTKDRYGVTAGESTVTIYRKGN